MLSSTFATAVFVLQVSIKHSVPQPIAELWQLFQQVVLLWRPRTTTEVSPLSHYCTQHLLLLGGIAYTAHWTKYLIIKMNSMFLE